MRPCPTSSSTVFAFFFSAVDAFFFLFFFPSAPFSCPFSAVATGTLAPAASPRALNCMPPKPTFSSSKIHHMPFASLTSHV